jgi:hypothetical protein
MRTRLLVVECTIDVFQMTSFEQRNVYSNIVNIHANNPQLPFGTKGNIGIRYVFGGE